MPAKPMTRAGLIYGMIYDIREVEVELAEQFGPKAYHIPISSYVAGIVRFLDFPLEDDVWGTNARYEFDEYVGRLRDTDIGAMLYQRHCDEVFEVMHRFNLSTRYNGQEFKIGMTVLRDAVTVTYSSDDDS